jgi:hypothetical protein
VDLLIELTLATNNFGNTRSGSLVGPLGGLIIALLLIGTVLLIRNMNARLRRLPEQFPAPGGADRGASGGGVAGPVPSDDPDSR